MHYTAEFEEKAFEAACNAELAGVGARVYAPGQHLENSFGYDAAFSGAHASRIWKILNASCPPGILLHPTNWMTHQGAINTVGLPLRPVSLIMQYKRPTYIIPEKKTPVSEHWKMAPYYKFPIDKHQQDILMQLETGVGNNAVVRYACPSFYQYAQLNQLHDLDQVLDNSNYVSPNALGTHDLWTYIGPGLAGYANPEPEVIDSQGIADVIATARELYGGQTISEHLEALATNLQDANIAKSVKPPEEFTEELLKKGFEGSAQALADLSNILYVYKVIKPSGASWVIADVSEQEEQ